MRWEGPGNRNGELRTGRSGGLTRTIADLEGGEVIRTAQVAEAIQYRGLDRSVYAEEGTE